MCLFYIQWQFINLEKMIYHQAPNWYHVSIDWLIEYHNFFIPGKCILNVRTHQSKIKVSNNIKTKLCTAYNFADSTQKIVSILMYPYISICEIYFYHQHSVSVQRWRKHYMDHWNTNKRSGPKKTWRNPTRYCFLLEEMTLYKTSWCLLDK